MTVTLWRIGTDTPAYTADDLTGEGAKRTGGRWNRAGRAMVYTSSSPALACLETIVHLSDGDLPFNRYLVRLDVPDDLWHLARRIGCESAPVGWDALPAGKVSLDIGDGWLKAGETALMVVPSVIVPEEHNVLINPAHPQAREIGAVKLRRWHYDARVWA